MREGRQASQPGTMTGLAGTGPALCATGAAAAAPGYLHSRMPQHDRTLPIAETDTS